MDAMLAPAARENIQQVSRLCGDSRGEIVGTNLKKCAKQMLLLGKQESKIKFTIIELTGYNWNCVNGVGQLQKVGQYVLHIELKGLCDHKLCGRGTGCNGYLTVYQ